MDLFTQTVEQWHDFYVMVGTAAATLIGLLFVGLSVNLDAIRRSGSNDLYVLAAETFNSFFYVLFFAIMFLIPRQTPLGLGIPLLLLGVLGMANVLLQWHRASMSGGKSLVAQRSILPILALICVIIIALTVLNAQTVGFYFLVPAMLLFLASASRNAWDLLIGMGGRSPTAESEMKRP